MNTQRFVRPWVSLALGAGLVSLAGCLDRPTVCVNPVVQSGVRDLAPNNSIHSVDILFEIDNSNSMTENQANLTRNIGVLLDALVSPTVDPATGRERPAPARSLHVGVISSDLGTPGAVIPSCANSDGGDNGLLNPIRNGLAIRTHQPWTTAPAGRRPARCTMDMNQYPSFLTFDAQTTDSATFREDFVCNATLSTGGCGLEQQLEAMYRALIVHDARTRPGNASPNAGFLRDDALLALVLVSDEEDGSVRDCRYAEPGVACRDAISVYDNASRDWGPADLNLRFYSYAPGSTQDPTWPIDRYIDPRNPNRGFTSLKPGRPDMVIFSAIAGVPIELPTTRNAAGEATTDWNALLGSRPDGSDGYAAMSAEGPVSMRARDLDPACPNRVVPACRREGSSHNPSACAANDQYFAWPARRIAEVARRFDTTHHNGTLHSICTSDYSGALAQVVERIRSRIENRNFARPLDYTLPLCSEALADNCRRPTDPATVRCIVRELLPVGVSAATACTAARGRTPGVRDPSSMREACIVQQVPVVPGSAPASGAVGFFYDTRANETPARNRISFTPDAELATGATAVFECTQQQGLSGDGPSC
jgi:hypothetical protein